MSQNGIELEVCQGRRSPSHRERSRREARSLLLQVDADSATAARALVRQYDEPVDPGLFAFASTGRWKGHRVREALASAMEVRAPREARRAGCGHTRVA